MIHGIDHINLVVTDLEQSVRFYTELLGFKEIRRAYLEGSWIESIVGLKGVRAHVVYVIAPAGEPRLELLCYESPQGDSIATNSLANTVGLRHIALRVENIQVAADRLRQAGVTLFNDPVTVPGDVINHSAGSKSLCYFLDPDGVILELAEYR